jgi:LPXTG-motif cell wall-anchored protein
MAVESNIQAFVVTPDAPVHMGNLVDVTQSTAQVGQETGCYVGCTPPTVEVGPTLAPAESVTPQVAVPPKGPELPFTGADVTELALFGTAAIVAGALLARRKRANATR